MEGNLDLSDFINLRELDCVSNKLTSLNLIKCQQLEKINCSSNLLTKLVINNNCQITSLSCAFNGLTVLDVSNCQQLTSLNCFYNLLTSLTLPADLTSLKFLCLSNNNFPFQDLSFLKEATNAGFPCRLQ